MKKIVFAIVAVTALILWLAVAYSSASPYCVCEKGVGGLPTSYEFDGLPLTPVVVPAQVDGNFKIDLVNLPGGIFTIRVRAINDRGVSDWSDPFTFTLDSLPGKPGVPNLSVQ